MLRVLCFHTVSISSVDSEKLHVYTLARTLEYNVSDNRVPERELSKITQEVNNLNRRIYKYKNIVSK